VPSESLEITVWVTPDDGSCTLRNETPASSPSGSLCCRFGRAKSPGRSARVGRGVAAWMYHLGHPLGRHDLVCEQRSPEAADVGGGGVNPAVAVTHDRQVEDVRPPACPRWTGSRSRCGRGARPNAGTRCRACLRGHTPARERVGETERRRLVRRSGSELDHTPMVESIASAKIPIPGH
jgi:hypothetical protein